jgi:hypothetical protein
MNEDRMVPESQYRTLQELVGELLLTNQKLREQVAHLAQSFPFTEPATHPQLPPAR